VFHSGQTYVKWRQVRNGRLSIRFILHVVDAFYQKKYFFHWRLCFCLKICILGSQKCTASMKLSKRLLSVLSFMLLALCVLFVYNYLNTLVSYKYEVQADEFAGNILNGHQREILDYISSTKTWSLVCLIFFLITFIVKVYTPNFRGKIVYVR
jgi:hypothetical protein